MVTTGARTGLQQQEQRQRNPSHKLQQQQQQQQQPAETAGKTATTGKRKGSTKSFSSIYRGKSVHAAAGGSK
jgi:hypothetical protein